MPEPIRHPLTATQQQQIARLTAASQQQQQTLNAYVQAIADGVVTREGVHWRLDGTDLVGEGPGPAVVRDDAS